MPLGIRIGMWLAFVWWQASGSIARDYFVTIGGGYEPQGNQVSLERNVAFFRQVLAEQRTDGPSHDIYFADGADPHRDLQFRDAAFECSGGRRMAIELFGDPDDIDIAYRNHSLDGVRDATSPRRIRERITELGRQMTDGDRLLLYATAHGGSGDDDNPYNTCIYTWNHRRFTAAEFARWLDHLPESTPVVMVMVQCYAGGFAHTIFNDADPDEGLARQLRAGFFAQVHDRPAAGCTPDVDEESYQEYSTFFWAAIAGHDRAGTPIEPVDFNDDGRTSFAEAHAYAVCESKTIDIPVRTSDAFLEYYSTDGATGESPYQTARNRGEPRRLPPLKLVRAEGKISELLGLADVVDAAIVRALAVKLNIDLEGNISQVDRALDLARDKYREARRSSGRASSSLRRARERLKSYVCREWPELDSELSPMLASLMSERADEFERKVAALPGYRKMVQLAIADDQASRAALDAQKQEALVLRLDHAIKRIVLSANLPHVASQQVIERYQQLLALESGGLNTTTSEQMPLDDQRGSVNRVGRLPIP